jgi:hypothetical protein
MDPALQERLDKMGSAVDIADESKLFRGCFYGDFGMGKTTLAGQLIGVDRAAWITSDSAWTALYKLPGVKDQVRRWPFEGFSQLRAIAEGHAEGIEPYAGFKWLVWDTVSTSVDVLLGNLAEAHPFEKEQLHPSLEGRPHYRMAANALKKTIQALNQSGLNIVYIAHDRTPSDADKEKRKYAIRPNMPEASYKVMGQEVNLIGWLHKDDSGKRLIQLNSTKFITAKCQIPGIEEKIYPTQELAPLVRKWQAQ